MPFGPDNFIWFEKLPWRHDDLARNVRDLALQRNYDISIEDYDEMLEKQGGVCAICANPETVCVKGTPKILSVDHDHKTGKVRGLLCRSCNTALGSFKDSQALLQKASEYLAGYDI